MNNPPTHQAEIVVGVDGSDASKDALRWAGHQAQLTGSRLTAIMTWHMPTMAYGAAVPMPVDLDPGGASRMVLDEVILDTLDEDQRRETSTVVVEGSPALELLHAAKGADLLVVGSRGHGAFTGMLLGSVSEHVVAHSPCPVVVVRHAPDPA